MWKTLLFTLLLTGHAWSAPCDCEVRVHSPITGSHRMEPVVIKRYELETFPRINKTSINACRSLCQKAFREDMPAERLSGLLINYSMELIEQKAVGYNCTGLTTLKYPVRVRATLSGRGLGNVEDLVQVVNHEEICF